MAARLLTRALLKTQSKPISFFITKHCTAIDAPNESRALSPTSFTPIRPFSSFEPTTKRNTLVNFSLPSDDEDDDDDRKPTTIANSNDKSSSSSSALPPPYDPFNNKPAIEDPDDPTDLQEVFHNMRSDGLQNNAVKMFDALSKDGLTHEALELFGHIKDKGQMPDVVAHTAVIEAYAAAGKPKDVVKVYMRMLACGVAPNAYTYSVVIKALARDEGFVGDARKYLVEMMGKGMRPNAGTYVAVFEAFARAGKEEEARELVEEMKGKGFVAEEKAVREVLEGSRGPVVTSVINILFGN